MEKDREAERERARNMNRGEGGWLGPDTRDLGVGGVGMNGAHIGSIWTNDDADVKLMSP